MLSRPRLLLQAKAAPLPRRRRPPARPGPVDSLGRRIRRDLDQVAVGIAAIDGADWPESARAHGWPDLDLHPHRSEMRYHFVGLRFSNETKIVTPGRDRAAREPALLALIEPAHIHLLIAPAEHQPLAVGECLTAHPQGTFVPGDGRLA